MKRLILIIAVGLLCCVWQGCTYTQKDYDLQEKYQERQRAIDQERQKDGYTVRW